jgi:hypothetical protein
MTNPFEGLAKAAEDGGPGAHNSIGAAKIRAAGLQYEQQQTMRLALECLNKEFARLDQTVKDLKVSIDNFNRDSGELYKTLNLWTKWIAGATIVSCVVNVVYVISQIVKP